MKHVDYKVIAKSYEDSSAAQVVFEELLQGIDAAFVEIVTERDAHLASNEKSKAYQIFDVFQPTHEPDVTGRMCVTYSTRDAEITIYNNTPVGYVYCEVSYTLPFKVAPVRLLLQATRDARQRVGFSAKGAFESVNLLADVAKGIVFDAFNPSLEKALTDNDAA